MTYPCGIIRDLLPLYIDDVCNEESRQAVENHLLECEKCRNYYEAMKSTEGFVEKKNDNSEDMKTILNEKMQMIVDNLDVESIVTITYFVPDKKKAGGAYVDATGVVKEIDEYERCIVMTDKKKISIEQVRAIEGELFKCLEL